MGKEVMGNSKSALVTIVIGKKYLDFYNRNFRKSHESFAKKIGVPLIVISDYIDKSEFGLNRHPAWQKLKIFDSKQTENYDRLCWIDADIYVTRNSKNPFEHLSSKCCAAVRNNIYDIEDYRKSDLNLYEECPRDNRPDYLLNTGFFIVSRQDHSSMLEHIYNSYSEQPCYENGPLSYHLINSRAVELDKEFNHLVPMYKQVHGTSLKSLYRLVRYSSFIHFCGGIDKKILSKVRVIDFILGLFLHQPPLRSASPDFSRLMKAVSERHEVKLHFGCGPRVLKGWINIDLSFEPYDKYLKYYGDEFYHESIRGSRSDFFAIDITKDFLPIKDNSVDLVFHEDFIEHLDQKQQVIFLAETLRVLKQGAIHRVNTPCLKASMQKNSNFQNGGEGVYVAEWDKHGHLNVLTDQSLKELALMVGYKEVVFSSRNKSLSDKIPREYRPDPSDRAEAENIFVDLIK